ncbi:MAG: hypothetical protein ACFFDH_05295 [Promethearchaeota archaeon]
MEKRIQLLLLFLLIYDTVSRQLEEKKIIVLNCPTELYNYDNPEEYRLPYDTEKIEYDWGIKMG